jgi:hypothetical protein
MNTHAHGDQTVAGDTEGGGRRRGSRWRVVAWTAAALLLLLPLIAMQFTDEVVWGVADFVVFAALLLAVGVPYELAVRKSGDSAYRAAAGIALVAAFLLVWINLAVGIIGDEGNPANLMYVGVLTVGFIGAIIARFRPDGMAHALFATSLAQAAVAAIALIAGLGSPGNGPLEIVSLNAFFAMLFIGSALLFRKAARGKPERGAVLG